MAQITLNPEKLAEAIATIHTVFGAQYTAELEKRRGIISQLDDSDAYKDELFQNEVINENNKNSVIPLLNSVIENTQELEEVAKHLQTRSIQPIAQMQAEGAAKVMEVKKTLRI